MKNVELFNWHLDFFHPVSFMLKSYERKYYPAHTDIHKALHLGIVLRGSLEGIFASKKISTKEAEFYLTAPWEPHSTLFTGDGLILLLLNIDWDSLQNFFFTGRDRLEQLIVMEPEKRMAWINKKLTGGRSIEKLQKTVVLPESDEKYLLLWNIVHEIFIKILPENNDALNSPGNYQRLLPVLKVLSKRPLSVGEASRICNLSISYFSVIFKKQFGLSFAGYERNFRLNGAAEAIRRGATLKEAAAEWGFCDKSHLARMLKKHR